MDIGTVLASPPAIAGGIGGGDTGCTGISVVLVAPVADGPGMGAIPEMVSEMGGLDISIMGVITRLVEPVADTSSTGRDRQSVSDILARGIA